MAKSGKPSADDIELFRRSVGPVRKVRHEQAGAAAGKAPPPRPRRHTGHFEAVLPDTFSDACDSEVVSPDETLFFARPGLQQRQLQRLKRGKLPIGAELDLHGMTAAAARAAVIQFIALCRDQHVRCARVIHGKGYGSRGDAPVLKNHLNNWLRQHHDVLAFSSALVRDGGSGALYVLLRSKG